MIVVVKNRWLRIVVIQTVLKVLVTIIVVVIVRLSHVTPHKLGRVLRRLVAARRLPGGITEVHFC